MRRKIAVTLHRLAFRIDTFDWSRGPIIHSTLRIDGNVAARATAQAHQRRKGKRKPQEGQDGTD